MTGSSTYAPSKTVREFMLDDSLVRAIMGPYGSGKSVGCVMELARRAAAAPKCADGIRRSRFLIVRNTFRMLNDTTIKTVFEWLPPERAGRWVASKNTFLLKFGDVESEWMFRALENPDDIRNLLSMELTGAWINEYREIDPSVFVNLVGRLGRYRPDKDIPGFEDAWFGLIMDSNPPSVDSFWYGLFEEAEDEASEAASLKAALSSSSLGRNLIRLFKQPSGLSAEAENIENLPANYYPTLVSLNSFRSQEWINVHVHGRYGYIQDGKPVYPEFSDIHVASEPLIPNKHLPIIIGVDFGLTPAVVFGQQSPSGRWMILSEFAGDNIGFERFMERMWPYALHRFPDHTIEEAWADRAGATRDQSDEKTCFEVLRRYGVVVRPAPQSLEARIGSVRRVLNRRVDGFLIDKSCKLLLKGFYGRYRYSRMQKSGEFYTESPEKNEVSHVHDALQYLVSPYESRGMKGLGARPFGRRPAPGLVRANVVFNPITGEAKPRAEKPRDAFWRRGGNSWDS